MRFTKIVATIGPATSSVENLERLASLGINVCRMNFSHGDYAVHGQVIDNILAVNKKYGRSLGIMLDTKGPEIRTGDVAKPIPVKKGERFAFTNKPTGNEKLKTIGVDYDKFADDAPHARCILIDNGSIEFAFERVEKGVVIAKALEDGTIGSRRHVNLPGAHVSLPSFTKKDWADIEFGVKKGVDFFATSFVRTGDDIRELKKFLDKKKSHADVIAKIETAQAVDHIDDIIAASDGIMVARGDLGAEVPFEYVPMIQNEIVEKCRVAGKPVIVATHMLESMILSPMPTRAEVTDIAYAAREQADSTMLSGETTTGNFPFKAVEAMDRVLKKNERLEPHYDMEYHIHAKPKNAYDLPRREQALAASVLASKLKADAIIAITKTGGTAKAVSSCRPMVPIFAYTESVTVQRKLMLVWGIEPHLVHLSKNPDETVSAAIADAKAKKLIKKGQRIVVVSDIRTGPNPVMTIQIRTI